MHLGTGYHWLWRVSPLYTVHTGECCRTYSTRPPRSHPWLPNPELSCVHSTRSGFPQFAYREYHPPTRAVRSPYYGAFTPPVPVLLIWELHAPCWVNTGFPLYSQYFRVPCMLFQHLALAAVNMAPVLPFSVVGSEQCPAASGVLTTRRTSSYYAHVRILFISGVAPVLFTRGHAYYSPQCPHVIHRHAYHSQDLLHHPWRPAHCVPPPDTPVIVVPDPPGVFLPGVLPAYLYHVVPMRLREGSSRLRVNMSLHGLLHVFLQCSPRGYLGPARVREVT